MEQKKQIDQQMPLQIIRVVKDNQQQKINFLIYFYFQLPMTSHEHQQHLQHLRSKYSYQPQLSTSEMRPSREPSTQYLKKIFSSRKQEPQEYKELKNFYHAEEKPQQIEKKENRMQQRKTRTMNELQRQIQQIRRTYAVSRQRILQEHPKIHQRDPRMKEQIENEKPKKLARKCSLTEEEGSPIKIMKDFTEKKKGFEAEILQNQTRNPLKTKENNLNERMNKKLEDIQRRKQNNEKMHLYLENKKETSEPRRERKSLKESKREEAYSFNNIDRIQERIQKFLADKQ